MAAHDVEQILERAHRHGDDGDFEAMAEVLREGLESFEGDPFLLCWLGVAERELGMDGIAYERFKQCVAADPEDPWVLATAGTALAAFDDPEAETALRAAAVLGPDVPLARWMYGAYLTREGMVKDGLRELREAVDLDPEDPVIRYELGVGLALADDRPAAIDELARAVELDPDDGWPRVVLGLLLLDAGRDDEAAIELDRAARQRDDDADAQVLASLALRVQGDEDRAWEMLERARIAGEGTDQLVVEAAEERLEDAEAARRLLREQLVPSILRERLYTRP